MRGFTVPSAGFIGDIVPRISDGKRRVRQVSARQIQETHRKKPCVVAGTDISAGRQDSGFFARCLRSAFLFVQPVQLEDFDAEIHD